MMHSESLTGRGFGLLSAPNSIKSMSKKITLIVFGLLLGFGLKAQTGTIAGKVSDKKSGETLFNAGISIEGGKGTYADFDGNYSLQGIPAGTYNVVVQYVGYQKTTISGVKVNPGKTTVLNVLLEPASDQLAEITVTAEAVRNSVQAIQLTQKRSAIVLEGVSSEQIRKLPDNNSADILKRTSGTTIEGGKYVIVRGLNDRYNMAMVNGAIMPGTDPDRKVFSFDLYPSSMIDNLYVYKTAQPELPGEFAGGLVQIQTKDFPDKNYLNVNLGTGMNLGTTFGDFQHYKSGGFEDQLGLVSESRDLPADFPATSTEYNQLSLDERQALAGQFDNSWERRDLTAMPFLNLGIDGGLRKNYEKWSLGAIVALNYQSKNFTEDVESYKWNVPTGPYDDPSTTNEVVDILDEGQINSQERNWGALGSVSAKFGNNQISLNSSFSVVSDDDFAIRNGRNQGLEVFNTEYFYSSSQLRVHQLLGRHKVNPEGRIKWDFDWGASLSHIDKILPDLKRMNYSRTEGSSETPAWGAPFGGNIFLEGGGRFTSTLREDNNNFFGNVQSSFKLWGLDQAIKAGVYRQQRDREFSARVLGYTRASNSLYDQSISIQPIDSIFGSWNLINPTGIQLSDITRPIDEYDGNSQNTAFYGQIDLKPLKWFRLVGGLRYESFSQELNSIDVSNRPIRYFREYGNALPSVNLIFSPNENSNIRASWSKTLSRPEFREVAPFQFYDYALFADVRGNTELVQTEITNYDLRYEYYFPRGQMVSVSLFYKDFQKPIEQFFDTRSGFFEPRLVSWQNAKQAQAYGTEVSWRADFGMFGENPNLKNWVFFGNVAFIRSIVEVVNVTLDPNQPATFERPMVGQSPYILNFGLQYSEPKWGSDFALLFNQAGARIAIVGTFVSGQRFLDVYENPRPVLDFKYTQRITERLSASISLPDIINAPRVLYQDTNDNGKWDDPQRPTVAGQLTNDQIKNDQTNAVIQPRRDISIGLSLKL
ncbi:TonB-dependent receptor plug domain-containing protein [bacterium]|nr:TonB-dependent receptor plug domain-containing protein [bacterium]